MKNNIWIWIVVLAVAGLVIARRHRMQQAAGGEVRELHFYVWANYVDPEVYRLFEKETGIRVVEEVMDSNEALENKLKAGVTGYDIVVPSDYAVQRLSKQNLLATIDRTLIPNLSGLSSRFASPYYDPSLLHSIPYMWGTSAIGFSKSRVQPTPTSWAQIFDPTQATRWKNRISLLDDPREVIGAALKYHGHSLNSVEPGDLQDAREVLMAMKPFVGRFDNENVGNFLLTGDIDIALAWTGTVVKYRRQSADIGYTVPVEGAAIWADNLAIPATADEAHRAAAHRFIDFLLKPEVNGKIVNTIFYASTLDSSKPFVDKDLLSDPALYPDEATMAKLEWMHDLGDKAELYEKIWTEFKN